MSGYPPIRLFAAVLGLALLGATLAWRIPFMLWDHLDFAPLYAAWQRGESLSPTIFWHSHGGHLHTAAYAVLLFTTWLSHGQTWMDCLASWIFLGVYAATILVLCRETFALVDVRVRASVLLIVFLALYPGHLANLQWGWQVAVFLCLSGTVVAIRSLTRQEICWRDNVIALCAATIAVLSFGIALALIPIALFAIAVRGELRPGARLGFALPWLLGSIVITYALRSDASIVMRESHIEWVTVATRVFQIGVYALNFLGAGIARFATGAAPWLGLFAICSGGLAAVLLRRRRSAWPWIGFLLFGVIGSILTALGRVDEGATQAFASRYVSFSSLFWLGWVGLLTLASTTRKRHVAQCAVFGVVALFAIGNAVAMSKRARRLAHEARVTAATVCATYPDVDASVLKDMHYAGADAARERLRVLHQLGFAPFDTCAPSVAIH
ncbi:MAG: hypothetical protein ABIR62_15665 [Dokdonella sp.]|uniref:hypothetical protein n=1 Tax=Dokdonella sp. TaxID=2291710 RepID=UPI003263B275